MRTAHTIISAVAATAALAAATGTAAASTTCTWGGTPAEPTGSFTIKPGLTNTPATQALKFTATGVLGGGDQCKGRVTFGGQIDAGGTCLVATFHGPGSGLRGVSSFLAQGRGAFDVPSQLFDQAGNHVGEETAELFTQTTFEHVAD